LCLLCPSSSDNVASLVICLTEIASLLPFEALQS
jgi:hypothetical protein